MVRKSSEIFSCELCDYNTSRKSQYDRHLSTDKHKRIVNDSKMIVPVPIKKNFTCACGKKYKYDSGYYRHKKKCQQNNLQIVENNSDSDSDSNSNNTNNINSDIIMALINDNKELKQIIIDQNKMIQSTFTDIIPKIGNTNSNNNSNNTNNINIVVNNVGFLNDNCKNALSINDFIESITIGIEDLEYTGKKGLANGLAKIFLENYTKLPLQLRPLWCGDKKRKKLYIKEEEWIEDKDNQKTKEAIKNLTVKQAKNTNKFTKEHPDWMSNDKKKDMYLGIIGQTTADVNDTMDKIISNIADKTHLSIETKEDIQTIEK
jgi:hypothetical protein